MSLCGYLNDWGWSISLLVSLSVGEKLKTRYAFSRSPKSVSQSANQPASQPASWVENKELLFYRLRRSTRNDVKFINNYAGGNWFLR